MVKRVSSELVVNLDRELLEALMFIVRLGGYAVIPFDGTPEELEGLEATKEILLKLGIVALRGGPHLDIPDPLYLHDRVWFGGRR